MAHPVPHPSVHSWVHHSYEVLRNHSWVHRVSTGRRCEEPPTRDERSWDVTGPPLVLGSSILPASRGARPGVVVWVDPSQKVVDQGEAELDDPRNLEADEWTHRPRRLSRRHAASDEWSSDHRAMPPSSGEV